MTDDDPDTLILQTASVADLLLAYQACDEAARRLCDDCFVQLYLEPGGAGLLRLIHTSVFADYKEWRWKAGANIVRELAKISRAIGKIGEQGNERYQSCRADLYHQRSIWPS